jgi:hypothetical protein
MRSETLTIAMLGLACAADRAGNTAAVPDESVAAAPSGSSVEHLLPLEHDTVFTYKAWVPQSAHPERLILQVDRRAKDRADLRSGSNIKRIEFLPDGARLLTGGYLLKAPLVLGAEWGGPAGLVRITAVDQVVQVAAGQFAGCLETMETGARGSARSIVTTYCPRVGIVKFSVDDGEHEERFELESFGPRVDINKL